MELLVQLAAETVLHAGHEHPSTLWIGVAAVLSFVLGVGVGAFVLGVENPLAETSTDDE